MEEIAFPIRVISLNLYSGREGNDESCFVFLDSLKPVGDPMLLLHICKIVLAISQNQVINLSDGMHEKSNSCQNEVADLLSLIVQHNPILGYDRTAGLSISHIEYIYFLPLCTIVLS